MRDARNGVSHSYDEALAIELAALVRAQALPEFERILALLQARA